MVKKQYYDRIETPVNVRISVALWAQRQRRSLLTLISFFSFEYLFFSWRSHSSGYKMAIRLTEDGDDIIS